jgi:hypothetical protein
MTGACHHARYFSDKVGSHKLFAWAGLQLQSYQSQLMSHSTQLDIFLTFYFDKFPHYGHMHIYTLMYYEQQSTMLKNN